MPARRVRAFAPLLLILAVACQPTGAGSSPPTASSAPSAAAYPLTLTDDAGREVLLPAEPERIVSLAPSNTEIVCALDACDRLVGVTDFDDYPAEVAGIPDVVIFAVVDIELVVDADPDLILAAGNELTPSAVITELTDLGYPVLVLYPESLDEVLEDIELIGAAINARDQADSLTANLSVRVAAVGVAVAGAARPRTFYEVGGDPITGDPLTFSIALEDLLAADPELILLGDAAYDPSVTPEAVAARPGWGAISAVQNQRVVVMLADPVITRPGPRIVDGLEALARAILPERFD
jgi:iron complex transport system substrate-binding protein